MVNRKRHKSWLRWLLSLLVKVAIACLILSVLLVLPWRWLPPPTSSFMVQSMVQGGQVRLYDYRWQPYSQIAPDMALAAVAAEDQQFPNHHGFDIDALQEAIEDYQQGGDLRGASTISQQVAKNLYLWSGRSLGRKVLEAWFTVLLELLWSKQRILEVYLNVAQFGDRLFGVEAASQRFFARPASELIPEEAALLAAVLPGPELYRVDQPSATVLERQDWILQQMQQLGIDYLNRL
ncbi:MAG: monofunctional biosynthetic peptidoglycan transglycosylase [Oscillatoriophycideae cyanobacterium NC_groundwater_1537_Pr4_S-0.65um_50_18]|nr:monofunctional biosynthetic peptidoglycan transglycosylase [Oscillatoriophycideae cyanobacterium NC_groundwater_1537_Pr4_S-0.65um_50_18]